MKLKTYSDRVVVSVMKQLTIAEAQAQLSKLVKLVESGEDVVTLRGVICNGSAGEQ